MKIILIKKNQIKDKYLIIFFFLLLIVKFIVLFSGINNNYISFKAKTDQNLSSQLFIDYKRGFNENDSIKLNINASENYKTYKIKLHKFNYFINKIRIDPSNTGDNFNLSIKEIKINDRVLDLESLHVNEITLNKNKNIIKISNDKKFTDPYFSLNVNENNYLLFFISKVLSFFILFFLVILLIRNIKLNKLFEFVAILLISSLSICILTYLIFESNNFFSFLQKLIVGTNYMSIQTKSLFDFKLFLDYPVDPILLGLKNPYHEYHLYGAEVLYDLSLYNGKYYLYWSIFPSIVLFVVNTIFDYNIYFGDKIYFLIIFSIYNTTIYYLFKAILKNKYLSLIFTWVILTSSLMTFNLRQLYYPEHGIYQVGYIYSQIFLNLYLILIFNKINYTKFDYFKFGILIGLIFFARYSLLFLTTAIILFSFFDLFINKNQKEKYKKFIILILPSFFFGISLLLINYFKFDDFFNFGQKYQIGSWVSRLDGFNFNSIGFYILNFYKYLFYPPIFQISELSLNFPHPWKSNDILFIISNFIENENYGLVTSCNEAVYGILWMFPFLFIGAIYSAINLKLDHSYRTKTIRPLKLLAIFILSTIFLFSVFFSNTRYFLDFYILLIIPAIVYINKLNIKAVYFIMIISLLFNIFFLNNNIPKYKNIIENKNIEKNLFLVEEIEKNLIQCHL